MFCLFWKPTWYIWKWLPHALPLPKSCHNYSGTVSCELGGLWEISDVFLMLAEPLLDKFCIVFCVSFIVKHRVAIWEEKQHGRGTAGNGNGQINIGRHPPLGEIRGMGSRQHRQSLTAGTFFTVPFSLIFIQIHGNFSFRYSSSPSVRCWAFPALSWRNKTDL